MGGGGGGRGRGGLLWGHGVILGINLSGWLNGIKTGGTATNRVSDSKPLGCGLRVFEGYRMKLRSLAKYGVLRSVGASSTFRMFLR